MTNKVVEEVVGGEFVRAKSVRQVATATSDGAIAAIMAEKYLASLK